MKRNNYYVINRFFLVLHIVLIVAILFCNDEKNGFLAILGYGAEKIMILAVVCLMLVAVKNKNIKLSIQFIVFYIIYAIFCLFLVVNYQYSFSKSATLPFLIRMIVIMFIISCVYSINHLERISKYIRVFILFVSVAYILTYPLLGKNAGIYMNLQYTTTVLSAGIGFFIPRFFMANRKAEQRKMILYLCIIMFAILLTGKRALLVVPVVLFFVIALFSYGYQKYKKIILLPIISLIAIGVLFVASPSLLNSFSRFGNLATDDTYLSRTYFWTYAMTLFKKSPFIGNGFGTFPLHIKNGGFDRAEYHYMKAYGAHNIYYQMLAEIGMIGLVIFIALLIVGLVYTIRLLRKTRKMKNNRLTMLLLTALYCQLWFILYGFTGNPLYMPGQLFTYIFGIIIAMSVNYKTNRRKKLYYD